MLRLIRRSLVPWLIAAGCGSDLNVGATTVADHERVARHYEAIANSIELQCFKARRNELTVGGPPRCWKAQDVRFLETTRDGAAEHRAAAAVLRAASISARR